MDALALLRPSPPDSASTTRGRANRHFLQTVPGLLLGQATALVMQAVAVWLARHSVQAPAGTLSVIAFTLGYASAVFVLAGRGVTRASRNAAIVSLGLTTALQARALSPLLFSTYDEQLHARTLADIDLAHELFLPQSLLAVSPRYPGLEALTALLQQIGLPTMLAAVVVVLAARLVLVLALCDAAEQITGSMRAGGLAVAVYAVSPQFLFFNSQYAYQTLALPLAVTAVALIGRARKVADARLLLGGAAICLMAVAVTHHVTSLLTAVFLLLWGAVSRGGQAARRIRLGALIAVASTGVWVVLQWSLLSDYLGPIAADLASEVTSPGRRRFFTDSAGFTTPTWERLVLFVYAAVISATAATVGLAALWLAIRRRRSGKHASVSLAEPAPGKFLALLTLLLPAVFVVRVLPNGTEISDRTTSFLFLPFSVVVAAALVRMRRPQLLAGRTLRVTALILALVTFIGGYLFGGGPDWIRLPGPYLVVADSRSMDPETLAAVSWLGRHLPAGSRITADRVGADLLNGQAHMWPVLRTGNLDPAALYFADHWGPEQTTVARELRIHYVYVDRRWADGLPHMGAYFHPGETPGPQRLTTEDLTKFISVPGVTVTYRHGPVTVYDISGLGIPVDRTGRTGQRSDPALWVQLGVGLLVGLASVFGERRLHRRAPPHLIHQFRISAGPFLTVGAAVASACLLAVILLLLHVWLGPASFAAAAVVFLVAGRRRLTRWGRTAIRPRPVRWRATTAVFAATGLTAVAVALAVSSSYSSDVRAVQAILDDPAAVHQETP